MDRDGGRGRRPFKDTELDTTGVSQIGGGRGVVDADDQGDANEARVAGICDTGRQVLLSIKARRVCVDSIKKRRSYIRRLEQLMGECDGIISGPGGLLGDPGPGDDHADTGDKGLLRAGDRRSG